MNNCYNNKHLYKADAIRIYCETCREVTTAEQKQPLPVYTVEEGRNICRITRLTFNPNSLVPYGIPFPSSYITNS